jgi:hypothetical protein
VQSPARKERLDAFYKGGRSICRRMFTLFIVLVGSSICCMQTLLQGQGRKGCPMGSACSTLPSYCAAWL